MGDQQIILTKEEIDSGKHDKEIAHKSCTRSERDGKEVYIFSGVTGKAKREADQKKAKARAEQNKKAAEAKDK